MNISELTIKRPVLATVLVLVIVLFGIIGYLSLPVREYPNVDNPIITVRVNYPGANAEVIENQITEPLEQNINGIPGIRSLTSQSSQGSCRITVEFELDVDLETAANDVRDKVSRAQRYLPRDVDPPTVSKADADASPIMQITVQSPIRSLLEISEIAELTVKEQLQTISNVSAVDIWGENRYAMRLWLDPMKMAAYGVTPLEVKNALDKENIELPAGSVEGDLIELSIRTLGLMKTPEEFNNLILKEEDKRIVRFKDIGFAEIDTENRKNILRRNGVPMVNVVVVPQPGSNQVEIADNVYERLKTMQKDLPDDVKLDVVYDSTKFVRASIKEVQDTIVIAFLLVVFIIFVFLREWRVTMIPTVVIPISLVGAFFVMFIAGFSINVLSMLAVVLSVGLVVDDAIVVTENIYRKIEQGMEPRQAAIEGSKEIFFAIISTTITLVSVFSPIVFMQGMSGRLFREFSLVISGAVIISSFVALTFTPMLSSKILKKREKHNTLYRKTEPFFERVNTGYEKLLQAFLRHKSAVFPIIAVMALLIVILWKTIPSELAPLEDRSQVTVRTTAPEGATFEYVRDYTSKISYIVDSVVPERESNITRVSGSSGNINVILPDIKERKRSQMEIADALSDAVRNETEGRSFVQQQSTFGGRRGGMPVQYVLQATNIDKLREFIPPFMEKVEQSRVFRMSDVIKLQPKVVVILAGTNDIAGNTGPSTLEMIEDNLYSMTELAQFHGIRVVLCSVLPAADYPWRPGLNPAPKIVELNRRIKEYAQKHHAIYCDYFSAMADENNGLPKKFSEDGVHPNKEGYAIMAPLVESALSEALKTPSIKVGDIGK
jgi:multidrug efflux pump